LSRSAKVFNSRWWNREVVHQFHLQLSIKPFFSGLRLTLGKKIHSVGNLPANNQIFMDSSNTMSSELPKNQTRNPGQGSSRWKISLADDTPYSTKQIRAIKHNFQEHPLMQLPALAQLAKDLMATKQCRFVSPDIKQNSEFLHGEADPQGRTIDEVFANIESPGSWVALYNVETHPKYKAFLDEVMACFKPMVEAQEPGIFELGGFIFVSAPPSVTPFHIDRENNFWLQIAGRKEMSVWDANDREVVSSQARSDFVVHGALDDVKLRDEHLARRHLFNVGPGDGVYFPSTSPHMTRTENSWVKPGDAISISIGVVFYTETTRREANVHVVNRLLRKHLGMSPLEPGQSAFVDSVKYGLSRCILMAHRALRGYSPSKGL
jgi:hypothetical protein